MLISADITAKTYGEEQTPLHYAARYDSVEAMKVLIQGGAMIDSFDFLMRTPLQVASEIGTHALLLKMLWQNLNELLFFSNLLSLRLGKTRFNSVNIICFYRIKNCVQIKVPSRIDYTDIAK